MNSIERKLFREQIIREYKEKLKHEKKPSALSELREKLRKFAPLNIVLGLIACVLLIVLDGWTHFLGLILSGIIWITLISTALSLTKSKD